MVWASENVNFFCWGVILGAWGCENCSLILNIPVGPSLFSLFFAHSLQKKTEQSDKDSNIQVDGPGQSSPAEEVYGLPPLASITEAQTRTGEIETEVMSLFEQYRAPLLRYSVSFGVPIADAEEIVQEVFLSLFRHLRLGRSRRNLRGWIFRVAHNLTLKRRYANRRQSELLDDDAKIAALPSDPSGNPEESCKNAERQHQLLAIVQALPEIEQSCLRMRAEGLRYREIATVLGISLGSVSVFLTRSLAKLIRADRG
jgi:RNA polymerase sigma-70 factor (ECF subfamily)